MPNKTKAHHTQYLSRQIAETATNEESVEIIHILITNTVDTRNKKTWREMLIACLKTEQSAVVFDYDTINNIDTKEKSVSVE